MEVKGTWIATGFYDTAAGGPSFARMHNAEPSSKIDIRPPRPLPYGRGSDRSRDRKGAVSRWAAGVLSNLCHAGSLLSAGAIDAAAERSHHLTPKRLAQLVFVGCARGDHFKMQSGHLVGGCGSPGDARGRVVGIARIGGGIIVGEFHFDARVRRQADGRGVAILALPVEIPIGDAEQGAARAIGEDGVGVHGFADV